MYARWKHLNLQKAKVVRQLLLSVVHGQTDGLLTSHRVSLDDRALGIDRSTRRLGWRGSSRGRLVLVGLEERHGYVFLRCGSTGLGGRESWVCSEQVPWLVGRVCDEKKK
jgi:hypothetical protein